MKTWSGKPGSGSYRKKPNIILVLPDAGRCYLHEDRGQARFVSFNAAQACYD